MNLIDAFKAARRVSAPLIAIHTPDQYACVQALRESFKKQPPLVTWDLVRGMQGVNDAGFMAVSQLGVDPITTANPSEALNVALQLPESTVVFCYNFHRVIGNEIVSQAVWNCREPFKGNTRTLVLLGPDMPLPAELAADVLVLDEPLPSEERLLSIVNGQVEAAGIEAPDQEQLLRALDAVAGLAAFPAEQVAAMSLTPQGLDTDALWERKRQAIEQAPGLSVYRGPETFDDIGGIDNAKAFGRAVLDGSQAPRAIVFIDEIEKCLAGTAGDTSGVSQEMLGTLLTWMQDKQVTGMLLVGPPGASKSMFAKALGNTGAIPTIQFDLSGMKGSLVGESGRNLRQALKVVDAVAQERALVVATCNSIGTLPPELRRRFNFGTFFFDLPTEEEREVIWRIYLKKFGLTVKTHGARPVDKDWTGAEIRMCCDLARRLKLQLIEAAKYIVPVAKSASEQIAALRAQASGRFVCASTSGVYMYNAGVTAPAPAGKSTRRIQEDE